MLFPRAHQRQCFDFLPTPSLKRFFFPTPGYAHGTARATNLPPASNVHNLPHQRVLPESFAEDSHCGGPDRLQYSLHGGAGGKDWAVGGDET